MVNHSFYIIFCYFAIIYFLLLPTYLQHYIINIDKRKKHDYKRNPTYYSKNKYHLKKNSPSPKNKTKFITSYLPPLKGALD